jgi:hypothetical protein
MQTLIDYFFKGHLLPAHSRYFKIALYLFVLAKCLYWLLHYDLLFGADTIVYKAQGHTNVVKDLAYILYNNRSSTLALYFILAAAFVCGFMLYRSRTNLAADLALWLIVENLHFDIYATLTGGDYLLNQLLFFNIFIAMDHSAERHTYREVYVCLHNGAITAVMIQVCIVYLVAGVAKLRDTSWLGGDAVAGVSALDHFSNGYRFGRGGLATLLTYGALFYQLLFPLLVWIRPLKIPLLAVGVAMHVYIMVIVGLPAFGLIMIISYIFFWPARKVAA